jgi:hypothetical protein
VRCMRAPPGTSQASSHRRMRWNSIRAATTLPLASGKLMNRRGPRTGMGSFISGAIPTNLSPRKTGWASRRKSRAFQPTRRRNGAICRGCLKRSFLNQDIHEESNSVNDLFFYCWLRMWAARITRKNTSNLWPETWKYLRVSESLTQWSGKCWEIPNYIENTFDRKPLQFWRGFLNSRLFDNEWNFPKKNSLVLNTFFSRCLLFLLCLF